MKLALHIAKRYLFAKKSHNVINVISTTSIVGMAAGVAALITILSVYNGFDALVKSMASKVEPDLMIVPAEGKFFVPGGDAYDWMYENDKISSICTVLEDNVFLSYGDRQGTARIKGVDEIYEQETPLSQCCVDGRFSLGDDSTPLAAVGVAFARQMGINRRFTDPLELCYPVRGVSRTSMLNPLSSVRRLKVWPSCEITVSPEEDNTLIVVRQDVMRSLLGCESEVSAVEVRVAAGLGQREISRLGSQIQEKVGEGFRVLDRAHQNPTLYKMLRYEKASIYLIMIFIVLIIGFSIFGCQSMTIIDKSQDIETLCAMGAEKGMVRSIFTLQGWMITLCGLVAGLVLGIAFSLAQQHLGLVKMPGNYLVEAYPAQLQWADVVATAFGVALLGWVIARLSSSRIRKK